jgi:hypothetical protein
LAPTLLLALHFQEGVAVFLLPIRGFRHERV